MQAVAREIHDNQTVVNIEDRIVAVEEIFRLQDADEYSAAERLYLSAATTARAAVVLAAGRGRGLEAQTTDRPKIMLNIAGKPLLRWLIDGFKKQQINQITVVGGYRADAIDPAGIRLVINERHAQTGELASLACAHRRIWMRIPSSPMATCCSAVTCCAHWWKARGSSRSWWIPPRPVRTIARCATLPIVPAAMTGDCSVRRSGSSASSAARTDRREGAEAGPAAHGRWIGLLNVSRSGMPRLKRVLVQLRARPDFDSLDMPALLNALMADGAAIDVQYVHGHWRGVNDLEDLRSRGGFRACAGAVRQCAGCGCRRRRPMLEAREFVEAARERGFRMVRGRSLLVPDAVHQLRAAGPGPAATCPWPMRAMRWP